MNPRLKYQLVWLVTLGGHGCSTEHHCEETATCPKRETRVLEAEGGAILEPEPQVEGGRVRRDAATNVVAESEMSAEESSAGSDVREAEGDGADIGDLDLAGAGLAPVSYDGGGGSPLDAGASTSSGNCADSGQCREAGLCQQEVAERDPSCDAGGICNGDGQCRAPDKAAIGEPCETAEDCAGGHCVVGGAGAFVCCESACSGQCQSCSTAGQEGLCVEVAGEPPAGRGSCGGSGVCAGTCDGVAAGCVFPGSTVVCQLAGCSDVTGESLSEARCNDLGLCDAQQPQPCGDFGCADEACRSDCDSDDHCRGDARCLDGVCKRVAAKQILRTESLFSPGGGVEAADEVCQTEFGGLATEWKALIVGGGRRATISPGLGNGQTDWVVMSFTDYFNQEGELLWTTDDLALLGVADGERVSLFADVWESDGNYPWSGYLDDWTTNLDANCQGWSSSAAEDVGLFPYADLTNTTAVEPCDRSLPLVCVEQ